MSPHGARRGRSGSGRRDPHGRIRARNTRSLPCAATSRIGQVMAVASVHSQSEVAQTAADHRRTVGTDCGTSELVPRAEGVPHRRAEDGTARAVSLRTREHHQDTSPTRSARSSRLPWRTHAKVGENSHHRRPSSPTSALRATTCLMTRMLSGDHRQRSQCCQAPTSATSSSRRRVSCESRPTSTSSRVTEDCRKTPVSALPTKRWR